MTLKRILLTTVAVLAISPVALGAGMETYESNTNVNEGPNGDFSEKSVTTTKVDKDGTAHTVEKNVRVETDSKGNTTKTITTGKTTDPKGLWNKTTEKTTDVEKTTGDSVSTTHEKKVNGTVIETTKDTTTK